jgi:hypothetical protein
MNGATMSFNTVKADGRPDGGSIDATFDKVSVTSKDVSAYKFSFQTNDGKPTSQFMLNWNDSDNLHDVINKILVNTSPADPPKPSKK